MSSKPTKRSEKSTGSDHWPHQLVSKGLFSTTPFGLDFADPGTGKTRVHVELFAERKNHKRMLVVCPLSLMQPAWGVDISLYAPRLSVAYAVAGDREDAFHSGADVVVINTDGVKWLANNMHLLADFDHLVIDELSYFKHPNSQRSKAMLKISRKFAYRYGMTGTPNPNTVMELWHQALIIDGGKRLGQSYYQLRNASQQAEQVGPKAQHLKWTDKPGMDDAFAVLLKDITVRHKFEEVMTHVPPNHRQPYYLDLPRKLRKIYDKFEADAYVLLENGRRITTAQAGAVRQKLLQICSGAVYTREDDESDYEVLDTSRYALVADLVAGRSHSVTFFNWRHQQEQLSREFKARGIEFAMIDGGTKVETRNDIVRDFQAGNLQTVAMHYKTGAHGLTLTRGDTTFFCSPIYEADYFKQAKHRIYRGAQDKPTNTVTMEANSTVERYVYDQLFQKTERLGNFLDMLKEYKHAAE